MAGRALTAGPEARTWTFLVHTLDQVGPPVFLLHFLRWLRTTAPEVQPEIIALRGGGLREAFEALGPVAVVGDPGQPTERTGGERWTQVRTVPLPPGAPPRRLVYVNTAASVRALDCLPAADADLPRVAHVHELEVGLSYHLDPDERERFTAARGIVAASRAVAENLVEHHHVEPSTIAVHHELIAMDDRPPRQDGSELRAQLGIPPTAFLIGTAAVVNWRKGVDLFLQLALRLRATRPAGSLALVWLGARDDEPDSLRFVTDRDAAGLSDLVHLAPFTDRPLDWMRTFDVFALTAREDAYPLACLEAASVGLPIVCFESGGMPEFVEGDAGIVVPYADIDGMVAALSALADDRARLASLGRRAEAKVRARHDVERVAPALLADLLRWEAG